MNKSKPLFEEYLTYIEDELGIQLLDWQKVVLRASCEGFLIYYLSRNMGKETAWAFKELDAAALDESLQKSIKKENNQ